METTDPGQSEEDPMMGRNDSDSGAGTDEASPEGLEVCERCGGLGCVVYKWTPAGLKTAAKHGLIEERETTRINQKADEVWLVDKGGRAYLIEEKGFTVEELVEAGDLRRSQVCTDCKGTGQVRPAEYFERCREADEKANPLLGRCALAGETTGIASKILRLKGIMLAKGLMGIVFRALDSGTDILTMVRWFKNKHYWWASISAGSIVLNGLVQCVYLTRLSRIKGWREDSPWKWTYALPCSLGHLMEECRRLLSISRMSPTGLFLGLATLGSGPLNEALAGIEGLTEGVTQALLQCRMLWVCTNELSNATLSNATLSNATLMTPRHKCNSDDISNFAYFSAALSLLSILATIFVGINIIMFKKASTDVSEFQDYDGGHHSDITSLLIQEEYCGHPMNDALCADVALVIRSAEAYNNVAIYCKGVTDHGCELLAEALAPHPSLYFLQITNAELTDAAAFAVAEAVAENESLRVVHLMWEDEHKDKMKITQAGKDALQEGWDAAGYGGKQPRCRGEDSDMKVGTRDEIFREEPMSDVSSGE